MRNFIAKILIVLALPFVFIALFFMFIVLIFTPKSKKEAMAGGLNIVINILEEKLKKKTENEEKINNKALE